MPPRGTNQFDPFDVLSRTQFLPHPRGPLSQWCIARIGGGSDAPRPDLGDADPFGHDAQLALYLTYELHYADPTFGSVDEWDGALGELRTSLERALELRLTAEVHGRPPSSASASHMLLDLIAVDDGPSLSSAALDADIHQLRHLVRQRSLYHLREADQHMMVVPRLSGRAKQLYVEIQAGEYGADGPGRRMHSDLYAQTMRELGLADGVNDYLDEATPEALLLCNLISLFTLNRRWRAAAIGHLATFECTSVEPMRRYTDAFLAAGATAEAARFYAVHILADAHHENVAQALVDAFAAQHPEMVDQMMFGAQCALVVESRFARRILSDWVRARN